MNRFLASFSAGPLADVERHFRPFHWREAVLCAPAIPLLLYAGFAADQPLRGAIAAGAVLHGRLQGGARELPRPTLGFDGGRGAGHDPGRLRRIPGRTVDLGPDRADRRGGRVLRAAGPVQRGALVGGAAGDDRLLRRRLLCRSSTRGPGARGDRLRRRRGPDGAGAGPADAAPPTADRACRSDGRARARPGPGVDPHLRAGRWVSPSAPWPPTPWASPPVTGRR